MKRKTLLFIITIISFTSATIAQIPKGSTLLGGSIGFSTAKISEDSKGKGTTITLSPTWGKAVKENTILGVSLDYGYTNFDNFNGLEDNKSYAYGAGVFVRKYAPIANRFYIFAQGRAGGGFSSQTYKYSSSKNENKGWNASISIYPGVSYAVNKKLHLETGFNNLAYLQFTHMKSVSTTPGGATTSKTNSIGFGSSLDNLSSLYIGFRFLLTKSS